MSAIASLNILVMPAKSVSFTSMEDDRHRGPQRRGPSPVVNAGQMKALGRSIGGGSASLSITNNVSVSMPAGAKPEDGQKFGAEISRVIVATVQAEMIKQRRHGGRTIS